jgi:hypothetical protein
MHSYSPLKENPHFTPATISSPENLDSALVSSPRSPMLQQLFSLTGKTAWITGGSQGLGKHMAEVLAAAGANILITDATKPQHRTQRLISPPASVSKPSAPAPTSLTNPKSPISSRQQPLP